MEKKKTTFVWILIILLGLGVLLGIYQIISYIKQLATNLVFSLFIIAIQIVSIILIIRLISKLYNVAKDVQKWVNIAFLYNIIATIVITIIVIAIYSKLGGLFIAAVLFSSCIEIVIKLCMWGGISMHLKRAKRDKLMDFS